MGGEKDYDFADAGLQCYGQTVFSPSGISKLLERQSYTNEMPCKREIISDN